MPEGSSPQDQEIIEGIRKRIDPANSFIEDNSLNETEILERRIPVCDDLTEFISFIRRTEEYKSAISQRKSNLRGEKVEENEIQEIFESTDTFRTMVINFSQDCLHLSYNPDNHSGEFQKSFDNYKTVVIQSQAANLKIDRNRDEIEEHDHLRNWAHTETARLLLKTKKVNDLGIAKVFVRLFLVDQGLDYTVNIRSSGVANYWGITALLAEGEISSCGNKAIIFDYIDKHPEKPFVDKVSFMRPPTVYDRKTLGDSD